MSAEVLVVRCGLVAYDEALVAQRWLRDAREDGSIPDVLLLLEHPPTYTRGRRSTPEELPMAAEWYEMQGIEVHDTDRGGRVTYHGPGQLVAYPIVDLRPLRRRRPRVRAAARAGGDPALAEHGVGAQTIEGLTGVWTEGEAPASGVRGRRGAQDRLDRRPRQPRHHHPRPLGQRQQRPAAVRVGRALRDRGLPGQLAQPRARRRAGARRLRRRRSPSATPTVYEREPVEASPAELAWRSTTLRPLGAAVATP